MPSNVPSATTEGDSSGAKDGRPRRIRMEEPFGSDETIAGAADAEQGAVGGVDPNRAGGRCRQRDRLAMAEGASLNRVELNRPQRREGRVEGEEPLPKDAGSPGLAHVAPGRGVLERVRPHARANEAGEGRARAER